jgi:RsiW-degrading membrane proteinase PrsW (M82 family)
MFRYLYIAFAVLLLWVVLLVNRFLPVPLFQKHEELINPKWTNTKPFENADTLSFAFVYKNLRDHYHKPAYQNVLGGLYFRDDKTPEDYYRGLMLDDNTKSSDAGHFGRAFIYNQEEIYDLVHEELNAIKRRDQPYYYCALGWVLAHKGYYADAIEAFKKELDYKYGNIREANKGLAVSYHVLNDYTSIHERMSDPSFVKNCPDYILEKEYFLHGPILSYLSFVLDMPVAWDLFFAAALIALLWGYYYTQFKIFASKDYFLYAFIFIVSSVVTPFCVALYDVCHYLYRFVPGEDPVTNLLYDIFAVGLIEEFTKAVPVFVCMLFFRKRIKEPIDYLLLATFSAIAFAFIENISYFDHYYGAESYIIIHKRTVLAVIMHVFCSSVIWYGFIRTKLMKRMKYVAVCVLISICMHGFYDFFLETGSGVFYIFAFLMVIFSFFALKAFYNTALNQSPLYHSEIKFPAESSSFILITGLSIILLVEFILNAIYFGAPHANDSLVSSLLPYVMLIVIYSSNLSRIILCKNHWIKMRTMFASTYSPYRTTGSEVVLLSSNKTSHGTLYPLYGKIIDMEDHNGRSENYIVKLTTPLVHNDNPIYTIMASYASKTAQRHKIHTKLYYEANKFNISADGKLSSPRLILLDYCLMETAVEEESWVNQINWNWKSISVAIIVFLIVLFSFAGFMNYSTSVDYYREAEKSLSKLNVPNASDYCGSALYFNENNFEARMLKAKIYMDGGFYKKVLNYLYTESSVPDYIAPDYYTLQGLAYYKLQAYPQAIESFLKCQQHSRQFDSLNWYQSSAYEKNGNTLDAIKNMQLFLSDKKHISKYSYRKMGDLYMTARKYSEAYFYFDQLISNKEYYAYALLQRGICNHYMLKSEQSCIDLETAHSYNDPLAIDYLMQWCRKEEEIVNESAQEIDQ